MSNWPPNYVEVFIERERRINLLRENTSLVVGAKEYYKDKPAEFIKDWCVTYDPRKSGTECPALMPFCTFPKQDELISFLYANINDKESGLIEKCRDMGATWICCAFSVWLWLFWDGSSVGWGSRKELLVDKIGDPDSIFEKIRMVIRYLPDFFMPNGFCEKEHLAYMKCINPENGSTITGEAGDNIGRGGRKLIYFKDESAHYTRPDLIEAALGDNTNTQIDISSVNGTANVFYRKRSAGVEWREGCRVPKNRTRIFIMDWRDHPDKTEEWYEGRKEKFENEGLSHVFAQEVDRDYAASVVGAVISPKWIRACIDAHLKLGIEQSGPVIASLDVADDGADKNAFFARQGCFPVLAEAWGYGDTTETAQRGITLAKQVGAKDVQYDCIGVGAGVRGETNRVKESSGINFVAWDAGATPLNPTKKVCGAEKDPTAMTNRDFFENLKSQAWWDLRSRAEKTYKMIEGIAEYPLDELLVIPSDLPCRHELEKELCQPTVTYSKAGKLMINKKPNGTASPNIGDSCAMAYFPVTTPKSFHFV